MQLLNKFNKRFRLLCVTYIYSKHAWVVSLKYQKKITITKAFPEIRNESGCKPKKIWEDKGSEFYNSSVKSWLQDNDIEMYSTHKEWKSIAAEKFIRTLEKKIYKYMTSILKNVYIDKLNNIVNTFSNTYYSTIKMKSADSKSIAYIGFNKENKNEDPKFKVGDQVRISKYKIFLQMVTFQIGIKNFF